MLNKNFTKKKKFIRTAISIFITIILLIYIISIVDFTTIAEILKSINLFYYILAILVYLVGKVISVFRWRKLLSALNMNVPLTKLFSFYFAGLFFNFFTPSNIGGDVTRMYHLWGYKNEKTKIFSSIFMDRFTGLLALCVICAIALIFSYKFMDRTTIIILTLFLLISFCVFILIFSKKLVKKFKYIYDLFFRFFNPFDVKRKIELVYESVLVYKTKRKFFIMAIILSFLFHITGPICFYLLSLALGLDIPPLYILLIFPIITILIILPISISGFGVREASCYYFLAIVGISASQTLSLLLAGYSIVIIFTFIGGVVHLMISKKQFLSNKP